MTATPVTDADRELLDRVLTWTNASIADTVVKTEVALKAIARARAEGAASEREACAEVARTWGQDHECIQPMFGPLVAAIRARGEGGVK